MIELSIIYLKFEITKESIPKKLPDRRGIRMKQRKINKQLSGQNIWIIQRGENGNKTETVILQESEGR